MVAGQSISRTVRVLQHTTGANRAAHESSELAWEIVVVDDASPDGTQEFAKELARQCVWEDKIVSGCLARAVAAERAAGFEVTSWQA